MNISLSLGFILTLKQHYVRHEYLIVPLVLHFLFQPYLSLPEASVDGLAAIMTAHYSLFVSHLFHVNDQLLEMGLIFCLVKLCTYSYGHVCRRRVKVKEKAMMLLE